MTRKNMLTLAIAGVLATALVGCGESESEKAATTSEAKKSASAVQELTKGARTYEEAKMLQTGQPDYFLEVDLGDGFTALAANAGGKRGGMFGGAVGTDYYLAGNFLPRDHSKITYTPFSWPFDEKMRYHRNSPEAVAMLEYLAPFYPKEEVLKFYAGAYYPAYKTSSHFEKQDLLNSPEVQAKVNEVYARGMQRSMDVAIPIEGLSLTYNPEKNRFEHEARYVAETDFALLVDPSNTTARFAHKNLEVHFLAFGYPSVSSPDADYILKTLEPSFVANAGTPLNFSLPDDKTRELANWLSRNPSQKLQYHFLGRLLHASIRKNPTATAELLFAPDALRVSTADGQQLAVIPMPSSVRVVDSSSGSYVSRWLQGAKNNEAEYILHAAPAAQ